MMLDGKKIIVTGAASGIGRATAVLAAREGADVAVADIDRSQAEESAALVQAESREAIVIEMDTSKAADAQRMADEAVSAFGTIDGIVCGAIKLQPSKLEDLTEEAWDAVIDVGLKGYFLCAQAAGRVMLENGSGSIVFLSSVGGVQNFEVTAHGVGDDVTFYENVMDWIDVNDQPVHVEQLVVARWKDGKIIHERFYYNM